MKCQNQNLLVETICMKCQNLFSGKNKKHIIKVSYAELAQSVVKVNLLYMEKEPLPNILVFVLKDLNFSLERYKTNVLNICSYVAKIAIFS